MLRLCCGDVFEQCCVGTVQRLHEWDVFCVRELGMHTMPCWVSADCHERLVRTMSTRQVRCNEWYHVPDVSGGKVVQGKSYWQGGLCLRKGDLL